MILIGFMICLNTFYGCGGLKNEPVTKNYFNLDINLPVSDQNNINKGSGLLVKEFDISPVFDSHAFVCRVGKNEYINDYYNEFINYPAKLVTEKIAETLYGTHFFKSALTNMRQNIDFRLSGKITRLYGDFQNTDDPKAIIEIRMILEQKRNNIFQTISGKTYLTETPVSSLKPDQLILGWNTGLSKIMKQFINDFTSL